MTDEEGRQVLGILRIKLAHLRSHPMYDDIHGYTLLQVCTAWEQHADLPLADRWRLARFVMRYAPGNFFLSSQCDLAFRTVSGRGHPIPRPVPWESLHEDWEHREPGERWYQHPTEPDFAPALIERLVRQEILQQLHSLGASERQILSVWLSTHSLRALCDWLGVSRRAAERRLHGILNECRRLAGLPALPFSRPAHSPAWYKRRQERRRRGPSA